MPQTKKLVIYPTSRAIREYVKQNLDSDGFLPTIITIGEFEKKVLIVKNRSFIDQDRRTLLMNEASAFSNFKQLHIPREFFTFLKNSKFLFGFFDELSVELVDIQILQDFDTYASYGEHLEILITLLSRYKQLLDDNNYVDKIALPSLYNLNIAYIKSFDQIELILEGYLSNFEFKIFTEIAEIVPLHIKLNANQFNLKMVEKFKTLDIDLKTGFNYIIDISKKLIISQTKQKDNQTNYQITPCHSQTTQIGFVKKKIYDYIEQGIDPQNIVVVLPNSNFAKLLNLFDNQNNLNFAMGFSYKHSDIFQKLSAQYEYYSDKNHQTRHKLLRLGFDLEKINEKQKNWNNKYSSTELLEFFKSLVEDNEDEKNRIYHEELHIFSKLFISLQQQPLHKVLHLFLNRLKEKTLDDTRGGKVTVMEVLETRSVSYEGVILVDFNEGIVPTKSKKDLFLSSELRFLSGLPTSTDRENLQKQYYKRLFDNAKSVSISYIDNEQSQPSRFIDELGLSSYRKTIPSLDTILFETSKSKQHFQKEDMILDYDFSKIKISATGLKCYLDCKRSYYFKYIKKLQEAEIPKDDNSDRIIGILLHDALKITYEKKASYTDTEELKFKIQSELYTKSEGDANLRFLVDVWLKKLNPFINQEILRAHDGYRIKHVEKTFNIKIDNLTLTGQIDRIDQKDNLLEVIDYKSGKIPKDSKKSLEHATNFQLQFYHLLASQLGEVKQSFYYDLNSSKLIEDNFFDEKLDILYTNLDLLKETEHNFTMTQDLKKCIYCPYIKICDRLL